VKLAADAILNGEMETYDRGEAVKAFVTGLGRDNSELGKYVLVFLREFKGQDDTQEVLAACIPAASPEIAALLKEVKVVRSSLGGDEFRKFPRIVRQAVALKLDPPEDGRQRTDAWLKLMFEEAGEGWASGYIRAELAAATPVALRGHAIDRIRNAMKTSKSSETLVEALKALRAELTPQEKKILENRAVEVHFRTN